MNLSAKVQHNTNWLNMLSSLINLDFKKIIKVEMEFFTEVEIFRQSAAYCGI